MRADLNKSHLYGLLLFSGLSFAFALLLGFRLRPGEPLAQTAAIAGALLLCLPAVFVVMKRSGYSKQPPFWFVLHVLAGVLGMALVFLHIAGGNWLSPPGLLLLILVVLVIQGLLARALLPTRLSHLFAAAPQSFNFSGVVSVDQKALQAVIHAKTALLTQLDPQADEALFSPALRHWLQSPWLTLCYYRLIEQEYRLVGARHRAGWLLAYWRRFHLLLAGLFYLGLLSHLLVVLFFAGYAADDGVIDWWYITDWGR